MSTEQITFGAGAATVVALPQQDAQMQALTERFYNSNNLLSENIGNLRSTIDRVWGEVAPPTVVEPEVAVRSGAIGALEDQVERYESLVSSINAAVNRISNVA